jgi:drug/metabolite transporter (DMT)-like permease
MRLPSRLTWDVIALIALLLVLDTFAQIFFKMGVTHLGEFPTGNLADIFHYCVQMVFNPFVISGIVALFFAFFTWLTLISKVDLSFAHPMTSLVFVTIPLSASWLLNESMHWSQIVGIILVVFGVFTISDDGEPDNH